MLTSPSLATPVLLSTLIHVQSQQSSKLSPNELFELYLQGHRIFDPIQHDQFDVYRLGYRQ